MGGVIQVPCTILDRARYVHVSEDGRFSMRKLKPRMIVMIGRCPSQGPDSTLPMRVAAESEGVNSVRTTPTSTTTRCGLSCQ
jgi:hypothetical protein